MKRMMIVLLAMAVNLYALPKEVQFDMLKTKLASQLKAESWTAVLGTLQKMRKLDIKLPDSMDFFEGKALFESGKEAESYTLFERYVTATGSKGSHYSETISYLEKATQSRLYKSRSVDEVEQLVNAGADVNAKDKDENTALMIALKENLNLDVIKHLIKLGADVNAKDKDENTVLMIALKNNLNLDVIKHLIKLGADVNAKDKHGKPAFVCAVKYNQNLDVIEFFIKSGVDIKLKGRDGMTALMEAASTTPSPDVIELLIKEGANVNAFNTEYGSFYNFTALYYAVRYNPNVAIFEKLMKLEDGFKSKERKTDLLLAAAYSNRNPDMVERLVKLGADIDARDSISDKTALMDAVSCNNTDVIERLIELGANTRLKTKRNNKTALDLLKKRKDLSYEDKQKLMKLLQ